MKNYYCYWGKADTSLEGYHPAAFHSLDVAAICEQLLTRDPVLKHKFSQLAKLCLDKVTPTISAFVALHDFGKFDARFQMKRDDVAINLDPQRRGLPLHQKYDHGLWGYHEIKECPEILAQLGQDSLRLLLAVCGHHGEYPSNDAGGSNPDFKKVRKTDRAARQDWADAAIALFRARGAVLPWEGEATMPLVQLLAGFCSVCDWLGSQVDYFPYQPNDEPLDSYYEKSLQQAKKALDALNWATGQPSGKNFSGLFPAFTPRPIQELLEVIDLPEGPALYVIEAPTADGKTEAAIALTSRLLGRGEANGLYFALPTIATSNGLFPRVEEAARRLFTGEVNLLLAHGKRTANPNFQRLLARPLTERYADEDREASVVCARWFLNKKRALLGQLGVGTVDQAMQAVLRIRHHFVRTYGISTSVFVLDEVHAYDVYMEVILERLIEWLGALRTPVILLSATLPATRRESLCAAYRKGLASEELSESQTISPAPYPLVTIASTHRNETHQLPTLPADRVVTLERLSSLQPIQEVLPRLIEAARQGAKVAWIRNTVTEAQETYHALCAQGVTATLFHARFRGVDRSRIEADVLQRFGKVRDESKGEVVIATQVIEQSLDLDFDWMVTDLAPVDLLIQRAGRLHRHQRPQRPQGFETPSLLYVVPLAQELSALSFGKSGRVYDLVILWLTQDILSNKTALSLPSQLRTLIEACYDPAQRSAAIQQAPNRIALEEAEAALHKEIATRQKNAKSVCIPSTDFTPSAVSNRADDDETIQALSRDGSSVTLLLILWDGEQGGSIDGGKAWNLDLADPNFWRVAHAMQDEVVSVPQAPGTLQEAPLSDPLWAAWSKKCQHFLEQSGMRAVLVPLSVKGSQFEGPVLRFKKLQTVIYHKEQGLRFEDASSAR
jgi:CRISPR-associated endonuclease/helicase Cas3